MKRALVEDALLSERDTGRALSELARAAGSPPRALPTPVPPAEALEDPLLFDRWLEAAADYLGVEVEPVAGTYTSLEHALARIGPGLVRVPRSGGGFGVLVVLASSPRDLTVLVAGQTKRRVRTAEVASALRFAVEVDAADVLETWTCDLPLSPKAKRRARAALLHAVAGSDAIGGMWLLRPRPGAPWLTQVHGSGDVLRVIAFTAVTVAQLCVILLGWSSLFDATLSGHLEASPLGRWVLLSSTAAFLEVLRSSLVGRLSVSVASILKRRALAGALRLDPNEIRARGSGGLLALVSEAEVVETAGLRAVVCVVSAVISLIGAGFVLSRGAGGAVHVGLLVAWSAVLAIGVYALSRRTHRWVDLRLAMTNGLVERMVGHRTRMAQERRDRRHDAEDAEVDVYLSESRRMDTLACMVQGLPSRGWLLLGFVFLLPKLTEGGVDAGALLVSVGGLFLAQSAFADIAEAISQSVSLEVAWDRAGDLFRAAAREEPHGLPAVSVQEIAASRSTRAHGGDATDESATLEARDVELRYRSAGEPALKGIHLRVTKGDRVLIEGASGSGKSTLAAVLAGLRDPSSGIVLHRGLDQATLGAATWRRKVSSVPQFHENHVLSGSLLFNLLLGRRWPATKADRALAEDVCRSLGLGPVIDRMPAGLEQIVGETGWQLSHGERTRVFIARALLQEAEVTVIDESFGALDPHTLRVAIDATWERAPTLLVIAHP